MKLRHKTQLTILKLAPNHIASLESPTTYEAVKQQAESGVYHVFSGGSTDTIFSSRKVQYAYRAWHDSIHIENEIDFSMESELQVAKLQEEIALSNGVNPRDAMLLRYDLECHIKYYYAKGQHPDLQLDLIRDCMRDGIEETVNSDKIYHTCVNIIRVEAPDGVGMFTNNNYWVDCNHSILVRHQSFNTPYEDGLSMSMDDLEWFCAYKSIDQLKDCVYDFELKQLVEAGYRIYDIETTKFQEGEHQFIYAKEGITKKVDITNQFIN